MTVGTTKKGIYGITRNSVTDAVRRRTSTSREALASTVGYSPTSKAAVARQELARKSREAGLMRLTPHREARETKEVLGIASDAKGLTGAPLTTAETLARKVAFILRGQQERQKIAMSQEGTS